MNLTGFVWANGTILCKAMPEPFYALGTEELTYKVEGIDINGYNKTYEYYISESSIVERIRQRILDKIDDLGYFYEHQDWENKGKVIRELLVLRGYLVDA